MQNNMKAGIIGYPLGHTLSPTIHNSAFKKLGYNIDFQIWETEEKLLKDRIQSLRSENVLGCCITLPYKKKVMQYLDNIDSSAKEIDAINWIINKNGILNGYNTDWLGFINSLDFYKKSIKNKTALIIGAGGSAKAICQGLIKGKVKSIIISNRTLKKAKEIKELFANNQTGIQIMDFKELNNLSTLNEINLIINATSLGMTGGPDPKKSPIDTSLLNTKALCYDLVYSPQITPFLREAKNNKIDTMGGLSMLVFQAASGFELLTNKKAPINTMLDSVGIKL
jgi:shikimate dehydrogenase